MNGNNNENPKYKGYQYPAYPLFKQLQPVPVLNGKTDAHPRHKKQERYSPYIQHGHRDP